jgi:TolB-like protein/tetratricopeptide (TPR) repeat protein
MHYDFGPFRADLGGHRLFRDGQLVPLKPKAFDLLVLLLENRDRVLAKDELMAQLWPDTIVEDSSLTQNVYELRRALGNPALIENVPRRGYRLVGTGDARKSVAVRGFVVLGTAGSEHVAMGIAESIRTALTGRRPLIVRPSLVEPGRTANASLVVEGSVQVAGENVRVTAQVVDVASGTAAWAERFDGRLAEIFQLQDAVSASVATAIAPDAIPATGSRPTANPEAYQLYLKGRYNWSKATPEALSNALRFFRAALDLDPHYALAYVGIADTYTSLDWYGVLSTGESNPHALAAAERAVELDPSLAEAHASLAMARQYAWDWQGAENEYRTAIVLNPEYAQAHQWYATFLAFLGRSDDALSEIRRAETLDPVSLSVASQVGLVLFFARRYEQAAVQLEKTLQVENDFVEALFYAAMVHTVRGELAAALAIYRGLPQDNPDFRAMLAYACAVSGASQEARTIVAALIETASERHIALFWVAVAQVGLGDYDSALTSLERACDDPDDSLLGIDAMPMLDPIRSHPRFVRVLGRMRLR